MEMIKPHAVGLVWGSVLSIAFNTAARRNPDARRLVAGTPLYIYTRRSGESAPRPAVSVDQGMLTKVMSDQREAAVRAHESGASTEQNMERCLLRTAMMSAAVNQALAGGRS